MIMDYILSVATLAGINMIAVLGLSVFTGFTGLFSLGHAAFVAVGAYTSAILTYYYYVPFYLALCDEPDFQAERFDTGYLDTHQNIFQYPEQEREVAKLAKLIAEIHARKVNPFAY